MPAGIAVQAAVDPALIHRPDFDAVVSALSHRGPDGCGTGFGNGIAFAQQRFPLSPHGGSLPYVADNGTTSLLLDGRVDYRSELAALTRSSADASTDAELVMALYHRFGERFAGHIRGSLVAVVVDLGSRTVIAARDALGKHSLYYYLSEELLLIASEPQALLRHPGVSCELDREWLASYFSFHSRKTGSRTPFAKIRCLLPGETLVWTPHGVRVFRQQSAPGQHRVRYKREEEYSEQYFELLRSSVERTIAGNGDIGIMLSGGMDSCPVACIAASLAPNHGAQLKAYSWELPGIPESDESAQIRTCADYAGIPLFLFNADRLALLDSHESWPMDLNSPVSNAVLRVFLRLYQEVAHDGRRILLQGTFGDMLYPPFSYWLWEALKDRKPGLVSRELLALLRTGGLRSVWREPGVRYLGKQLLRYFPRSPAAPEWLAPSCATWLDGMNEPAETVPHSRPGQFDGLLGDNVFDTQVGHGVFERRMGIVRVDPYHDWDMIEFMLSIPAYECDRVAEEKYVARRAMRGRMPEELRIRPRGGLLNRFFDDGFKRCAGQMRSILFAPGCTWPEYVRESVIAEALSDDCTSEQKKLLAWNVLSYELWRKALIREGLSAS